jgi:phosphoserine phosphatase RsbU/P
METATLKPVGTTNTQSRILIADDQQDVLEALRLLLKNHNYAIETVTSPAALLEATTRCNFDLILMDLNYARDTTSGREGIDLLADLKRIENTPPIVVMTGWASIALAVEAMQQGVGDFVEKPWVNSRLLEVVKRQIELGAERRELRRRIALDNLQHSQRDIELRQQKQALAEALAIQQGFLPKHIPNVSGLEIAVGWQPARVVAGDYFDTLLFGRDTLGLCIADVAGKGLPAALLMANLQAGVRGLASPSLPPDRLCAQLNALVFQNVRADRFITFFYAQIDVRTLQLQYTNAGHNAPIVFHRDGAHDRLDRGGIVLGVFGDQTFDLGFASLSSGDRVVFFTDGVTEAHDANFEEFGEARLLQVIAENAASNAADLHKKIVSATAQFNSGNWEDDATVIVLAVEGVLRIALPAVQAP